MVWVLRSVPRPWRQISRRQIAKRLGINARTLKRLAALRTQLEHFWTSPLSNYKAIVEQSTAEDQ